MTAIQVLDSRDILGKTVTAYGTVENPLFLAKDVAEGIGHADVTSMLRGIDDDEKIKVKIPPAYLAEGLQPNTEYWFLTESGLYKVLFLSRKPIAKEFKREVKKLLHDIRTARLKVSTPSQSIANDGVSLHVPAGKTLTITRLDNGELIVRAKQPLVEPEKPFPTFKNPLDFLHYIATHEQKFGKGGES